MLDLRDGAEVRRLSPHSGLVPAIAVDASRHRFATVSYDQSVRLWDTAALERPGPDGHQQQVSALALTADGARLLSGSKDGRVLLWDARTGTLKAEVGQHEHWVSAVGALPGDRAISVGWDGAIRVWDLGRGRCAAVIETGDAHLTRLACEPGGDLAVTASTDGAIRVWDLISGTERAVATVPDTDTDTEEKPEVVAVAIDGDHVRWMTETGWLTSWRGHAAPVVVDIKAAARVTACDLGAADGSVIVGLADGQLIEVGADGTVLIFGGADCGPTSIARNVPGGDIARNVPGGDIVLAAYGVPHVASDNTARLWAGGDRSSVTAILVGDLPWTAAAVADDGCLIYLGDESGAVHLVEPVLPGLIPPGRVPPGRVPPGRAREAR